MYNEQANFKYSFPSSHPTFSGLKTGQVTSLTLASIFVAFGGGFSPESGLQPGVQVTKEVEVDGDGAGHSIKLELFF